MRKLLFLLLTALLVMPASAQDFTLNEDIDFVPFMVEALDIQGLRPDSWFAQPNAPGVFLRGRDPLDQTAILMQVRDGSADDLLAEVSEQFALEGVPDIVKTQDSDTLSWAIYRFQRQQGNQLLEVDFALAELDERVFYSLMQTPAPFYDHLHENLFLPALDQLTPIQRYSDADGRFDVVVPAGWSLADNESYGTLQAPDESITIHVSASEAEDDIAAMTAFWQQINPDFDLTYADDDLRVSDDPAQIGDLQRVTIINWLDGNNFDGEVVQGVVRRYEGVAYIVLLESTVDAIRANDTALSLIDNHFSITALEEVDAVPATAEAP